MRLDHLTINQLACLYHDATVRAREDQAKASRWLADQKKIRRFAESKYGQGNWNKALTATKPETFYPVASSKGFAMSFNTWQRKVGEDRW